MAVLPEGYRRRAFESLASTSVEALAAARRGEPGGLWITAAEQTAGRGRRDRPWTTERGNLAASLMIIDPAPPDLAATLSFVTAVALHQAVVDVAGPAIAERLALKWPNDLLLDGAKTAGILVEGERLANGTLAVVTGIGVNCETHPDVGGDYPTGDFSGHGVAMEAEVLFQTLAVRLASEIELWNRGAGFAATRAAWLARSTGIGRPIRVRLAGRSVEGHFDNLDESGRLILTRADGVREAFAAGDVFVTAG